MHDLHRLARAHHDVFARQDRDEDDETTTTRRAATTSAAAVTSTTATRATTTARTTAAPATTTTAARGTTTSVATSTTRTPVVDVSSLLGLTSSSTTSSSSTSSVPTTTSSSTSSFITATPSADTTSSQRQLSTLTSTFTSSGSASAASATESASVQSGLSGAATGGIIAGCVLVGIAVLIFAVRKTFMARRKRKRNTWGAGVYPDINDKYADGMSDLPPPLPEKAPSSAGYLDSRTPIWAPPRPVSPNPLPPPPNSYYIQPPQASYNNAIMDAPPAMTPVGVPPTPFGAPSIQGETAVVRVLYIPTLPDELSITTGEVVQVIKAYDDGWALCANARGEQGVVPLECLDRNVQGQANRFSVGNGQQEGGGDWRNLKRMSSLSTQQPHY